MKLGQEKIEEMVEHHNNILDVKNAKLSNGFPSSIRLVKYSDVLVVCNSIHDSPFSCFGDAYVACYSKSFKKR